MPATKVKDIAVKTGEYQKDGQTKGRYENIGSIFKSDDGGTFLLMKRTFNPAGVPNPDNRDTVLISVFDLKDNDGGQRSSGGAAPRNNEGPRQASQTRQSDIPDDDIPFATQYANW